MATCRQASTALPSLFGPILIGLGTLVGGFAGMFVLWRQAVSARAQEAERGLTVLFVSHGALAVQSLCARAMWIKDGALERMGGDGVITNDPRLFD